MSLSGQLAFAISSSSALVPAAVLIYFLLKRVYHLLDDSRLYFMLGMALIAGVLVAIFQTVLGREVQNGDIIVLVGIAFVFSLFENLLKVILLNLKRFRQLPETTFYGAPFVVTGAMVAALHGFRIFRAIDASPVGNNTTGLSTGANNSPFYIVGFVLLLLGGIFYHGAMGIYNGYFSSKGRFWTVSHLVKVLALAFPFNFIVFWWYMTGFLDILVLGGGTLYSAIILYHITRKYYPLTLSPDEAEKLSETFPWKRKGGGALSRMGQRMRDIEERE